MALPSFFVTGLSKILAGEQPCKLEAWLVGHGKVGRRPQESSEALAAWRVKHTALMDRERARLTAEGWDLHIEQFFRVNGSAACITGKPDIRAHKDDCRPLIVDCKGGEKKDSHVVQVQLYQKLVPLSWNRPDMRFDGKVVHEDETIDVSASSADTLWPKATALVRELSKDDPPPAAPSYMVCRTCKTSPKECPAGIREPIPDGSTVDF